MDAASFTSLIKNPHRLVNFSLEDLEALSDKYPYAQSLYLLLAKKAFSINDPDYERYLSRAAIHSSDRKKLYHLIHNEDNTATQIKEYTTKITSPPPKQELKDQITEKPSIKKKKELIPQEKASQKIKSKRKPKASIKTKAEKKEPVISKKPLKKVEEEKPSSTTQSDEKHSFMDWLAQIKTPTTKAPVIKNEELEIPGYEAELLSDVESREEVSFSIPKKNLKESPDASDIEENMQSLAKSSLESKEDNVSETLASVYQIQKKYNKAIKVYERLILKYPNKKAYFAHKIENLKKEL